MAFCSGMWQGDWPGCRRICALTVMTSIRASEFGLVPQNKQLRMETQEAGLVLDPESLCTLC